MVKGFSRVCVKSLRSRRRPSRLVGGTAFGAHILCTVTGQSVRAGIPSYVLFADISAAFYSALLQLAAQAGSEVSQSAVSRALCGLRLPDEVTEELCPPHAQDLSNTE